jgi:chromosome partition protein MukF
VGVVKTEVVTDLLRTIARLHQTRTSIELSTTDLCFLVALQERANRQSLVSFEEDILIDVFLQVCEVTEPGADNPRKRATNAIQRLRTQRLLTRVDGAGVVRAGEYAMTGLSAAVVKFFLSDEVLTRESLALLTKTLISHLSFVKDAAQKASNPGDWRSEVVEPLRVTVGELVGGIERRQRGLDAQQEEVRDRIGMLLKQDWFAAVGTCEQLLEETAATLHELNEVLLQDKSQLQTLLQDIEHLAAEAGAREAEAATQRVSEHVDRVAAWGSARQQAWSDYYQYVQRYLRHVVRLDPDRALSQRLRDQLSNWVANPFSLAVADAPSIRLLRDLDNKVERPPVTRPRRNRELPIEELPADPTPVALEALVHEALKGGATSLAGVLERVLPHIEPDEQFRAIGQVTELVGTEARIHAPRERAWVSVPGEFEVEDWATVRSGGAS